MLDQLRKKQKVIIYIVAFVFIVGMGAIGLGITIAKTLPKSERYQNNI